MTRRHDNGIQLFTVVVWDYGGRCRGGGGTPREILNVMMTLNLNVLFPATLPRNTPTLIGNVLEQLANSTQICSSRRPTLWHEASPNIQPMC